MSWRTVSRPVTLGVKPIWDSRPDFCYCHTVAVLLMWGASLIRLGRLSFYSLCMDSIESTASNSSSIVAFMCYCGHTIWLPPMDIFSGSVILDLCSHVTICSHFGDIMKDVVHPNPLYNEALLHHKASQSAAHMNQSLKIYQWEKK